MAAAKSVNLSHTLFHATWLAEPALGPVRMLVVYTHVRAAGTWAPFLLLTVAVVVPNSLITSSQGLALCLTPITHCLL